MTSTVEATTQALLCNYLEYDQTKLMGASIDSKIFKHTEESKHHFQSFEDKLEESTNKCLKHIKDLIASLANKAMELTHIKKPRGATSQHLSKEINKHRQPSNLNHNWSWNQRGQASGHGPGCGCNQTTPWGITFDMSQNHAMDPLNSYSLQQQQNHTNQEVITIDNKPDLSTEGWGRHRKTPNNIPPLSLNNGLGH